MITIPNEILTAIRDQSGYDGEIKPEHTLRDDIGLDSLDVVALAVELEESPICAGKITDDEIESWSTVGDVVATITRRAQ